MFKSRAHHEHTGGSMIDFLWDEGDPVLIKEGGYTSRIANRVLGVAKSRHLSGQSVDLAKLVDDVMRSQPRMSRGAIDPWTSSLRDRILNRVSERIDKVQARAGQSTGKSFVSPSLQKQGPRHVDLRGAEGYRPEGLSWIKEHGGYMGIARRPTRAPLTPSEIKQMNLERRGGTAKSVKRARKARRDRMGRRIDVTREEQRAVPRQLSLAERMEQPGVRERVAIRRANKKAATKYQKQTKLEQQRQRTSKGIFGE